MAAYTGPGNFPYWMTIVNTGAQAVPAVISENIPVTVGVNYQFNVVCSYATTYAAGMQVFLQWYNANGSLLSQTSLIIQSNMTGGVLYEVNSGTQTAPANASYALAYIQSLGTPLESNPLQVFEAQMTDQDGNIVNVNYAFTYTTWPWSASTGSPTLAWNFSPLLAGDSDSLVIDGQIEVMGGIQGVQCTVPELLDSNGQGPTFRLLAPASLNSAALGYQGSYDLNAPQPTQDVVASMLLDGERPFGDRASNRTMVLPIVIFGTQAGGMSQVLAAREYLMSVIDQQTYTIKWTSADTGLPMLFDCFRALPSLPVYGMAYSAGGSATGQTIGRPNYPIAMITLEIQALPYGRSDIDGIQNLSFASPIVGGISPQAQAASTLDTFTVVYGNPPILSNPALTQLGFTNPTSSSTWNIATSSNVAAGNTVIVLVQGASTAGISVSDTQGNVYTQFASQSTGSGSVATYFIANVANPLTSGVDHATVSGVPSANYTSVWNTFQGGWVALTPAQYSNHQTGSTFSQTFPANEYNLFLYLSNGLGSAGTVPTGFQSQANSGNGFNNNFCWYSQPLNQSTITVGGVTSLPNPSAEIVVILAPANRGWQIDTKTVPGTYIGGSARYNPISPIRAPYPAATYQATLPAAVSIVGNPVLSMYFGQSYDPQWPKDPKFISNVTFQWTLTDDVGRKLNFSSKQKAVPWGTHPSTPRWRMINTFIPQGKAFNYNAVTAYTLRITNWHASGHYGYVRMHAWINNIVANPQTIQNSPSPRGAVYQMLGLPGSARSPISVQCQLPATQNITKEITSPATGNWIVPPGVYSVQAEAWAGGGAGAAANLTRTLFGGGGGGGEYAQEPALNVLPGRQIPWSLGAGGTPGQLQNTVVQFAKPGLGHWLCPPNVTSVLVETWGGGAAGGAGAGGGGGAEYAYVNMPVTPGVTYSTWTGAGGKADTGTSTSQVHARNGTASWFGPAGNLSPTAAYVYAYGGNTSLTGSSSGGLGGKAGAAAVPTVLNRTGFATPAGNQTTATIISQSVNPMMVAGDTALVVVQTSAAATISLKDSAGNKYTQIGTCNNTGAFTYAFACFNAKAMSRRGTVTVNGIGGNHVMALLYDIPATVSLDVAAVATSGTGTTASVTSGTGNFANDAVIAIISSTTNGLNGAGTNAAGFVYGSASFNPSVSPVLEIGIGLAIAPTTAGITANPTFASSTVWSALALTLRSVSRQPGGRGGTSPGPSGGGGGGAAGLPGPGGVGGNSLPATATGRWQAGGAGGTGSGSGGNGGAGAPTPGFPVIGSAPGGGGGGGYQTAPIFNPANPSGLLPGQKQTNFLGADGGVGMVQLTYAVGSGLPVNGGNTTFGSTALTGTQVVAHGGTSAANNSAAGGAGGSGSSNTIHNNGGSGGFNYETTGMARASYLSSPYSSGGFITLNSGTWNATGNTTGVSAASVNQGVSIALIASAAKVVDLSVTDSAGNIYQPQGIVTATGGNTVYAYVADVEYPITTATTLTIASATSQQYAVLWYGSTYYVSGVTSGNSGSNSGTSSTATAQFGVSDTQTVQVELGVVTVDSSRTVSSVQHAGNVWFNASSTNALTWNSTCQLSAFYTQNLGGGTGAAGSGDTFQANLSGSGNWATLAIPLAVANQQSSPVLLTQLGGVTPGAQTAWNTNGMAIQGQGMIVVAGQCGSGASITAAPTAIADTGGNKYTFQKTQLLPSNGGVAWVATAPVTAALPATATGTINWGTASGAPNYAFSINYLPNASGVDGVSSVTGNSATVSGSFSPTAANDFVYAHSVVVSSNNGWGGWAGQYNWVAAVAQSYMRSQDYATQAIDLVCPNFTSSISNAMPWATIMLGLQMNAYGTGGGAAGGAGNAGYPGIWGFGGPGYTGGGKGGQGAAPPPQNGNGASYPGGGGGGCLGVSGTPYEGGQGAPGAIRLTWTPPLQPFNTLIVHSLGANADPNVNPCTPIPITDTPNNTEYLVPSLNGIMNATFNSTYTVLLSNFVWNSATSSTPRHITVTINQYEYPGGPKASVQVARAVTPATDSVNGLLSMGEVTLPVKDYLKHNDQSYFTVSINDTDQSDRFMDVLMLDTLGQTTLINIDPGQPGYGQYINYFIDEATSDRDLGFVGASFQERQHQVSVLDYAQISGGQLYVGPGDNLFFVYSPAGAPNLALQYAPRWYLDRTV